MKKRNTLLREWCWRVAVLLNNSGVLLNDNGKLMEDRG